MLGNTNPALIIQSLKKSILKILAISSIYKVHAYKFPNQDM